MTYLACQRISQHLYNVNHIMPKRYAKPTTTPRKKRFFTKPKMGTPAGVLSVTNPVAPKPYMGRGGDVKWFNGILNPNDPFIVNFIPAGAVYHVNPISQGTGQNKRIGNTFRNLGIHLKGWIDQGAANAGGKLSRDTLRVSLVWDASPNKTAVPYESIYNVSTAALAGTALPNYTEEDRFKIMWSKTYTMQSGLSDDVGRKRIDLDEYVSFPRNLITKCVGGSTGSAITIQNTGALLLCIGGSLPTEKTDQFSELYCHYKIFFDEKTS